MIKGRQLEYWVLSIEYWVFFNLTCNIQYSIFNIGLGRISAKAKWIWVMKKRDSRNDILNWTTSRHCGVRSNLTLFPYLLWDCRGTCWVIFNSNQLAGWHVPYNDVARLEIATQERHYKEFSGIFAETPWQSHRNVTQGDCFVAVWFIMVKIYPAPRNDERLV